MPFRRTVFHDDNDYVIEVERSEPDGLGNYRLEVLSSDFPEGRHGKSTRTEFNPSNGTLGSTSDPFVLPDPTGPWVLTTYDLVQVTEGIVGDGHRATVDFRFDPATGFLLGKRFRHPVNPAAEVLVLYEHDGNGNLTKERSWGGDVEPPESLPSSCSVSVTSCFDEPSSPPQFVTLHSYAHGVLEKTRRLDAQGRTVLWEVHNEIDANTGLARRSYDSAGFGTSFLYDSSGRIREARPDAGAWALHLYTFPTVTSPSLGLEYEVRQCPEGTGTCSSQSALAAQEFSFDRLGRMVEERRKIPIGSSDIQVRRNTAYDRLGRVLSVSEWGRPSAVTEFLAYDRFGRPGTIRRPDGSETSFTYTGSRVERQVVKVQGPAGEVDSVQELFSDAKGRLIKVSEQSGPGGAAVETTYEYDEGDRLIRVCSNSLNDSCGQQRTFNYDDRGFLRSESYPEIGETGNGTINYLYDARGNVVNRSLVGSTAFDLTFRYDAAERLTQVENAAGELLKELFYRRETETGSGTSMEARWSWRNVTTTSCRWGEH